MVTPIKHSTTSSLTTTGWEVGKYGLAGAALVGLAGAAVLGGMAALAVAVLPGVALTSTAGVAAVGVASAVGFLGTVSTAGAAVGAGVGGIVGLIKGRSRVSRENGAYEQKLARHMNNPNQALVEAQMAGLQQGYVLGAHEGRQKIINDLRGVQEQMLKEQQLAKSPTDKGHVHKITEQRGAQASVSPQVG